MKGNPITLIFTCRTCHLTGRKSELQTGLDRADVVVVWCLTCDQLVARLTPSAIATVRGKGCEVCGANARHQH